MPTVGQVLVQRGPNLIDSFLAGATLVDRLAEAVRAEPDWLGQLRDLVSARGWGRPPTELMQVDLFEQFTRTVQDLARQQPLVLILDDLQWADPGSLGLLFHLGRRLEGWPILLVGAYRPADVAAGQAGERHPLEAVIYEFQRWLHYRVRGEQQTALELGQRLLDLAQNATDPVLQLTAYKALGATWFNLGDFAQAQTYLEQGIALYDRELHRRLVALYAEDVGLACYFEAGATLWQRGDLARSQTLIYTMLDLAQSLAHPFTLAGALFWAAYYQQGRREVQAVYELSEALLALAGEHGFSLYLTAGSLMRGWALAGQGQPAAGVAELEQVLTGLQAAGIGIFRAHILGLLGEAYGLAGRLEAGLNTLDQALLVAARSGERHYEAELYRLKGTLLAQQGAPEAEVALCYRQAIEVARRQQALPLELRATLNLSRLWHGQGKTQEARQIVMATYRQFRESEDAPDLAEARTWLAGL
jgi:predicted ATPase